MMKLGLIQLYIFFCDKTIFRHFFTIFPAENSDIFILSLDVDGA